MIPYGKHSISKNDVDAVVDILENHFLTQGPKVGEFETALCAYTGASDRRWRVERLIDRGER